MAGDDYSASFCAFMIGLLFLAILALCAIYVFSEYKTPSKSENVGLFPLLIPMVATLLAALFCFYLAYYVRPRPVDIDYERPRTPEQIAECVRRCHNHDVIIPSPPEIQVIPVIVDDDDKGFCIGTSGDCNKLKPVDPSRQVDVPDVNSPSDSIKENSKTESAIGGTDPSEDGDNPNQQDHSQQVIAEIHASHSAADSVGKSNEEQSDSDLVPDLSDEELSVLEPDQVPNVPDAPDCDD